MIKNPNTAEQIVVKEGRSRVSFCIGMFMFLGSIFARNIFDIAIPIVVILTIAGALALICDRDELFALMIACIPTTSAFQYKYFVLVAIVIYILKFGKDIKYRSGLVPLMLMMVWELSHAIGYNFSIYEYLRGFCELILCTIIMMSEKRKIDYALIVRTLCISTICMLSIVLLNLLRETGYNFEAIFTGDYRFGVGNPEAENYGVNYNANGIGSMVNMCVAGLLQLNLINKQKAFDYVMIVALLFFGILSMSRAFVVVLAILIILYIFAVRASIISKLKRIFISAVVVLGSAFLVAYFMPTVFESFIARFEVNDVTNGRAGLFEFYTNHIFSSVKYMLLGVGLQGYQGKVMDASGYVESVCHNGTQEIIVCWGFIGFAFFAAFLVTILKKRGIKFKRKFVNFIPLIVLLVSVQSGQFLSNSDALLRLAFACLSLDSCMDEERDYYSNE